MHLSGLAEGGSLVCSDAPVKLASWNCCGKFDTNVEYLFDLGVDIAVVSEAKVLSPWPTTPDGRTVTGLGHRVWSESPRELVVLACDPWSVTAHEAAETAPAWMAPVRVSGPTPFVLVGLWTVEFRGVPSYVRQIDQAIDWIEQSAAGEPVVLAGDFNAPISSSQAGYDKVAYRLERLGLVDAYRFSRGLAPGDPTPDATYFHHRRLEQPFHIDHVMLPARWVDDVNVELGDFDTWVDSGRSDHVPVVVDIIAHSPG
jgi:hypothetical protein